MSPGRRLSWPAERCRLLAAALAAAWVLGGCGPGVGGTGTGKGFEFFSATATTLCTSEIVDALNCARIDGGPAVIGTPATIDEGTGVVFYSDSDQRATVQLAFSANTVQLEVPCRRLRFDGEWGIAAGADARFFGIYTEAMQVHEAPASMQVQTLEVDGTARLAVTVQDGNGRTVVGPVLLQRLPQPGLQAPC